MRQWFLANPEGFGGAYIYRDKTVIWDFHWDDPTYGPVILAVAMPSSVVSIGDDVTTPSNGFYSDCEGINHYTTLLGSQGGGGYRLLITGLR